MKIKLTYIVIIALFAIATALAVFAEPSPSPTPSPSPAAQTAAMALPRQTQAAFLAGQIIQQVTTLLTQAQQIIDNGVPAQDNGHPAISATDIQAALGTENVMRLRSAVAILTNGAPSPTPAPAPNK